MYERYSAFFCPERQLFTQRTRMTARRIAPAMRIPSRNSEG
jgi:hypothetical protein